jgi:outer membrane protein OmpA-like peptidoglycan-associated protein
MKPNPSKMKQILVLLAGWLCCLPPALPQTTQATKSAFSAEVYFDFGKHDLRPEAESVLGSLLKFTEGRENYTVRITAHTDSVGSFHNNDALSQRRAEAVMAHLTEGGLPAERITLAFFGEKSPSALNATEEGRQANRRATVEVLLTVPTVAIEGTVTDEKTGLPLRADVVVRTKDGADTLHTGDDGYFRTEPVPVGTVVGLDAYAKCHFMRTEMAKAAPKLPKVPMPLKPAATGATADIGNLYFVGNQPVLLESSLPELPKILRFMELNPTMKIEIAGHVNRPNTAPVSKTSWDFKLSEDRAKTVFNYLLDNGISEERITWKGYGNHQMRFPRAMEEREQALNRRVELRVLEGCE